MKVNILIKKKMNVQTGIRNANEIQNPLACLALLNASLGTGLPNAASWQEINLAGQPNDGTVTQLAHAWGGIAVLGPAGAIPFRFVQASHRLQLIGLIGPPNGFGQIDIYKTQLYGTAPWYIDGGSGRGILDIDVTSRFTNGNNTGGFGAYVPFESNSSLSANGTYNNVIGYTKSFRGGPGQNGGLIGTIQEMLPLNYPQILGIDQAISFNAEGVSLPPTLLTNGLGLFQEAALFSQYIIDVDDVAILNAGQNGQRVYIAEGDPGLGNYSYGEILGSTVYPDTFFEINAGRRQSVDTQISFVALDMANVPGYVFNQFIGPLSVNDSWTGAAWNNTVMQNKTIGVSSITTPIPYEPF